MTRHVRNEGNHCDPVTPDECFTTHRPYSLDESLQTHEGGTNSHSIGKATDDCTHLRYPGTTQMRYVQTAALQPLPLNKMMILQGIYVHADICTYACSY